MAELKPYTNYRCPGCRATSIWTGAYTVRRPGDDKCAACGEPVAEEAKDGRRWRVRWEHVHPLSRVGAPQKEPPMSDIDAENETGAQALAEHDGATRVHPVDRSRAAAVLAAVLRDHDARLREHIAQAIEADDDIDDWELGDGLAKAAAIARTTPEGDTDEAQP